MNLASAPVKDQKKLEATLLEMKKMAQEDPVYFVDTFLWTFNPKEEPYHWRFKTFAFQKRLIREIIEYINDGEDLFIEKCREMGATYTVLAVFLWMWLWSPGANFLVGSRKEDYVDNRRGGLVGNKEESLFGKLDYMMTRIPGFILPEGYNPNKHFNYMSLVNPENGNAISGESSNENFSRGGRQRAILLDEFSFWPTDTAAWGSTADTTNCRIVLTTPGIKPGKAKRLRFGKDGEKIKLRTLPYNLDPRKTAKWLAKEKDRRSEEDFNREIMINWEMSIAGRVYAKLMEVEPGNYPFIENAVLYCSGDYGLDGTAWLFWQINPKNGKARLIDGYMSEGQIIQFYFPLFGKPIDSKFEYSKEDKKAINEISQYPPAIHFGDVDVRKKSFVKSTSTLLELAKAGIHVNTITTNDFLTRRDVTKEWIAKGLEVNNNPRTTYILECMQMYRYPKREEGSQATTPIIKPIHDFTSHPSTAMEYFFLNLASFKQIEQDEPDWAKKTGRRLTSKSSIKQRRSA